MTPAPMDPAIADPRQLYLDLLARSVTNFLYLAGDLDEAQYPDREALYDGRRWLVPDAVRPHSGLRLVQLWSLHRLALDVLARNVPGDFVEAGVWRGGVVIFLAGLLRAYDVRDVRVWAADSFAGIPCEAPPPGVSDPVVEWTDRWTVELEQVKSNIRRYGLLDDRIRFLCGPFRESLPQTDTGPLALLRLDADAYASTRDALESLYPRLSPGGYVIIDDWHLDGCRRAVLDYREAHAITAPIHGVFAEHEPEGEPYEVFWNV